MTTKKKSTLFLKLLSSTLIAIALLVVAVFPAEYGKDPTGIGAKLGLVALAAEPDTALQQPYERVLEFNVEEYNSSAERIERSIEGLVTLEDIPFQNETILIELEDLGEMEHKFIMREGMSFVYSWKVTNAKADGVYYDFHGHPKASNINDYPDGFEMAYSKSEGSEQSGSFRAPFGGLHGFYFMNLEEGPITIELNVSGYFSDHHEVYRAVDGEIIKQLDL